MTRSSSAHATKGGSRKSKPDGFDKVLYVRADKALLDKLEEMRRQRSARNRGITLSTADVARSILWEAIDREIGGEKDDGSE